VGGLFLLLHAAIAVISLRFAAGGNGMKGLANFLRALPHGVKYAPRRTRSPRATKNSEKTF